MEYHITKDNRKILISELTDKHLLNIIKIHKRLAKNGVKVRTGGGSTPDDFWYEEYIIYGNEALEFLNHKPYLKEAKRRKLIK